MYLLWHDDGDADVGWGCSVGGDYAGLFWSRRAYNRILQVQSWWPVLVFHQPYRKLRNYLGHQHIHLLALRDDLYRDHRDGMLHGDGDNQRHRLKRSLTRDRSPVR